MLTRREESKIVVKIFNENQTLCNALNEFSFIKIIQLKLCFDFVLTMVFIVVSFLFHKINTMPFVTLLFSTYKRIHFDKSQTIEL